MHPEAMAQLASPISGSRPPVANGPVVGSAGPEALRQTLKELREPPPATDWHAKTGASVPCCAGEEPAISPPSPTQSGHKEHVWAPGHERAPQSSSPYPGSR